MIKFLRAYTTTSLLLLIIISCFQFSCEKEVIPKVIDDKALLEAEKDESNWLTHGRTYKEQRHSPLNDINTTTVNDLGLAWSYEFDDKRGLEATPIVVDGVLYTTSSWSILHAFNAATGEKIWTYNPEVPRGLLWPERP